MKKLILVVEDDPDVRKVVRRSLIDLGYAVVPARDAAVQERSLALFAALGVGEGAA